VVIQLTDMRRRKQGDRVLNKTPKWVLDGLQQMETDDPKGTSEILIELNEYRSLQGDKYYTTGRYYDHTSAFLPFVLKRLGWVNLMAGTGRPAKWLNPEAALRS
tara:strand:+ start:2497 stop:2808 length:312 start_codon:yes stop_codon:yes gene_type:complete